MFGASIGKKQALNALGKRLNCTWFSAWLIARRRMQISGSEYLAILTGISVSALSESDFTAVDIV
ncbi:MAG: hypothetical protein ACKVI7_10180 [Rhodobacterales bacterium]|jgi:hypothetical protein